MEHMLHTYIYWIHTDAMITDAIMKDAGRRMRETQEERTQDKDAGRLLFKYIYLSLYCKGFERVVQGLHVRGCWRPNINFIFWPHCYDRHAVSFLLSWCWGLLHRGFPRPPRSGVVFPTTSGLYCLEVCWQLLWHPELNWVK